MSKFNRLDRIRVYGVVYIKGRPNGDASDVTRNGVVTYVYDTYLAGTFDTGEDFAASIKQCRKLKPKRKRRVFVLFNKHGEIIEISLVSQPGFKEFVEAATLGMMIK